MARVFWTGDFLFVDGVAHKVVKDVNVVPFWLDPNLWPRMSENVGKPYVKLAFAIIMSTFL